jgi:hypothetical protein
MKSRIPFRQYSDRFLLGFLLLVAGPAFSNDAPDEGNASNLLAAVEYTDLITLA